MDGNETVTPPSSLKQGVIEHLCPYPCQARRVATPSYETLRRHLVDAVRMAEVAGRPKAETGVVGRIPEHHHAFQGPSPVLCPALPAPEIRGNALPPAGPGCTATGASPSQGPSCPSMVIGPSIRCPMNSNSSSSTMVTTAAPHSRRRLTSSASSGRPKAALAAHRLAACRRDASVLNIQRYSSYSRAAIIPQKWAPSAFV